MTASAVPWQPPQPTSERVEALIQEIRAAVSACLTPLVRAYYPALLTNPGDEYRKMIELSTKMTLVGCACTEVAGLPFDARRMRIGSLYGGCCFLADSFIDDFGEETTREYLERFETLLTRGWFEIKTEREKLFYVIVSRLFAERDVFHPLLRQAILRLFEAQRRDVELRLESAAFDALPRRRRLKLLRQVARDRGGQTSTVLSRFLVPEMSLAFLHPIFLAGGLFMYIDDHGDCYSDLHYGRSTFMNQVQRPAVTLRRIFSVHVEHLLRLLPDNAGRQLLIAFLTRYFLTRIEKHRLQERRREASWAVYE